MISFLSSLRSSLVYRLVTVLLLSGLALTVATTLLRLREDREARIRSLEEYVRALERGQLPTLASSLWMLDLGQAQLQLAGYLNVPFLAYAAVEQEGKLLASAGSRPAGRELERTFTLAHDSGGRLVALGTLHLVFDQGRIDRELAEGFVQRLLAQGGLVFFISALTLFLSRRMITVRLSRLARAVAGVQSDRLAAGPASLRSMLPPQSGRNDELDRVVAAMSHMGLGLERAFAARRMNQERLEALLKLSVQARGSERELVEFALEEGVRLTASRIGCVHYVEEDGQTLRLAAWSRDIRASRSAAQEEQIPIGADGIWADCLRTRRPTLHNDMGREPDRKAWPEGHPAVERQMCVPVFDGDRLVAIAGVGNKGEPYDEADSLQLALYLNSMWSVLKKNRAEEALRKSEETISSILDNVDEGFIVLDPEMRIQVASRAYCRQVGRTIEEVMGKHCYGISHRCDRPCAERGEPCAAQEAFSTGRPAVAIHSHEAGDGRILRVEIRCFPLKDAAGQTVSVIEVLNDTTERSKLEEQLRQAQKLEAIGLLAGGVAHDFNNILMAIVGYATLVNMKLPPGDPVRPSVDQILFAADRATHLTASLLAFGRKQIINPRPLDLNEVLAQIGKLLRRVIGEDIDLKIHPCPGHLVVFADRVQLEQVFLNLATNARDAMAAGGEIVISTRREDGARIRVEKGADAPEGPCACITVSDTGVGMDVRTRERIFEPFFTTKGLGRGTGLGLSTVYGIIAQSKGFIEVSSEPGQGTTFMVYLPLVPEAAPAAEGERRLETRRGTETILLAEDDAEVRSLMAEILRSAGYTVIEAVDGEESVRLFAAQPETIDLALLDVIMPRCDGRRARDAMRLRKPSVRVLFMSGYAADLLSEKGHMEPGLNLVAKPVLPLVLLEKVREALDRA